MEIFRDGEDVTQTRWMRRVVRLDGDDGNLDPAGLGYHGDFTMRESEGRWGPGRKGQTKDLMLRGACRLVPFDGPR